MIEASRHKDMYFAKVYEKSGEYTYRFKTAEEYQNEQGVALPFFDFQETLTWLDDLVNFHNGKNDKKETKEWFVDFIKGVLILDPRKRWTPSMSWQHPFISRKKYEGPFTPKIETVSKKSNETSNQSIDADDNNSDSSSVSRK